MSVYIPVSTIAAKVLQEERGCGIEEAKEILRGRKLHKMVDDADQIQTLRVLLHVLVDKAFPR